MAYSGKYKPKNWTKYKGAVDKITYRSLWELRLFQWADSKKECIQWASEETIIPYFDPVMNKKRRYFMDLWAKIKRPDGTIQEFLIEVKPKKETMPPKLPKSGKRTATYKKALATFITNQAKWSAAKELCDKKGWKFLIFTEDQLNLRGR